MFLDLNDPDSIVAWWVVFPARHDGVLEQMLLLRPQVAPAIKEAQRRIAASDELQALLTKSLAQQAQQRAYQAERNARMSSVEMLRSELLAA